MVTREIPKLPQARLYLKSAEWGLEQLLERKLSGYAFRFHLIGILASLRASQHALLNHDHTISDAHREAIDRWRKETPMDGPQLSFIKWARDSLLKAGAFDAYATVGESGTGEGANYQVTSVDYDLAYYRDGERHELLPDLIDAIEWCDIELSKIEAKLPPLFARE